MKLFVLLVVTLTLLAALCSAQPVDNSALEQPDSSAPEQSDTSAPEQSDTSALEQPDTSALEQPDTSALEQPDTLGSKQLEIPIAQQEDSSENIRLKRYVHHFIYAECRCSKGLVFLMSSCLTCEQYLDLTGKEKCPERVC